MSVKEMDNENATGNVYTIYTIQKHTNKSIEHVNQQQQGRIEKHANVIRILEKTKP